MGSIQFLTTDERYVPWVPEVFLACGGNFRCWPKADTSSAVDRSHERRSAGHYKNLTETGNGARKVSGTQGKRYVVHKTKESTNYAIKACDKETSLETTLDINSLTYEFANTER